MLFIINSSFEMFTIAISLTIFKEDIRINDEIIDKNPIFMVQTNQLWFYCYIFFQTNEKGALFI
ncbi:hypothetical protein D1B32_02355 [Oceanobacillus profundus]|uniref:Uncharacterized protein n=1 Tax=Oceanobacillus profundus TaxID=372463 RepID=A0A417YP38_9BACI|nr:hypothetical protein D1B32_02355 [Oceanobacillus profundus]